MARIDSVGIYFHKSSGKWAAQIRHGDVVEHIGLFEEKLAAARAYDKRARKIGKKTLNFIDPAD